MSFKGILRISGLNEVITDEDKNDYWKVSSSDGYCVDLKLNKNEFEVENLNVIGNVTTNNIDLSSCKNLYLGTNTKMPDVSIIEDSSDGEDLSISEDPVPQILVGKLTTDDETGWTGRVFSFETLDKFLNNIFSDIMLEINQIPTGTIVFANITYDQFKSDDDEFKDLKNDYLPCDGEEYDSAEYPELAKILNDNRDSVYWDVEDDEINVKREEKREFYYGETTPGPTTFRVPDLRAMFVQSCSLNHKETDEKKITGSYELDAIPEYGSTQVVDNHYHYIILDNKPNSSKRLNTNVKIKTFAESAIPVEEGINYPLKATDKPGAITRYGSFATVNLFTYAKRHQNRCYKWPEFNRYYAGGQGRTPIYTRSKELCGCRTPSLPIGPVCGYILSSPKDYNGKIDSIKIENYIGLSSWNIPLEPDTNLIVVDKENSDYTKNDDIYNQLNDENKDEYASIDVNVLGYENTPEFYTCLPLIKI